MTLNHQQPDRVAVDFGGTAVTGMHVAAVHRLRQALIPNPSYRVKVIDPYQMLGEIDAELAEILNVDVEGLLTRKNIFGFENQGWKPFTLFDGTPVLVPEDFNITIDPNGDLLLYPEGDLSVPPSGRMPKGFHFFDSIIRQPPVDDEKLNSADNTEEFALLSKADIAWYTGRAQ